MRIKLRFFLSISSVFAVALCIDAQNNSNNNDLVCQLFDASTKSVAKYCKWFNGELPQNCLTRVPFTLPSIEPHQVIHMKIGGCNSSHTLDALEMYRNIESLDMSFSGLETLNWLAVKCERLKTINASFNLISQVPWRLFIKNVPEIIELDLSHNKITILNETSASENKLQKIHFSHN